MVNKNWTGFDFQDEMTNIFKGDLSCKRNQSIQIYFIMVRVQFFFKYHSLKK